MSSYTLTLLPLRLGVCSLPPAAPIPAWAAAGDFFSLTRTGDELSVICAESQIPPDIPHTPGWVCLKVEGPFDFSVTGVLAALAAPLAAAGVPCLTVATYQTDYLLVQADNLPAALAALRAAGHTVQAA
jgi:hypothetical protein